MEKIIKTGIMAASTAAGCMAIGMSGISAYASELDPAATEVFAQEVPEAATVAEAQNAVDEAQMNVTNTETAVTEAQINTEAAQQEVQTCTEAADTARADAEQAFDAAKTEAAAADSAAQANVDAAQVVYDEAEAIYQPAAEDASKAAEALETAENDLKAAEEASLYTTQEDITQKESELAEAESTLAEAEIEAGEAELDRDAAAADAEMKESAREEAETAAKAAEAGKAESDAKAAAAADEAEKAANDLARAEGLKDGTLDITETDEYKEVLYREEELDKAGEIYWTTKAEVEEAENNRSYAEAGVQSAKREVNLYTGTLNAREAKLAEEQVKKDAADSEIAEAQNAYDNAVTTAYEAKEALNNAETALTEADKTARKAGEDKKTADEELEEASKAVETARRDVESAVNAEIAETASIAEKAREGARNALKAVEEAAEKYAKGTLGLIDWMLGKQNLTKDQVQDLNFAREVLVNASKEDFSKWDTGNTGLSEERGGKVIVIGDEDDATNLENLQRSIDIMKKINELRAGDDNYTGVMKRSDSYTNFYFMATAEAGAMRGAGLARHSLLTTSCENLAFGYSDPTLGWYDKEKAIFDRIKGELGIAKIASMADVSRIESEADKQGVVVGHYTNLFWAADQVMGVGFTGYQNTSCYNASNASTYNDDRYNRAMHLYTVGEFEQIVSDYSQTVNKEACEAAYEKAASERDAADSKLQTLLANKDATIEKAVKDSEENLAARESAAKQAAQNLVNAEQALADAKETLRSAQDKKDTSEKAAAEAETLLGETIDKNAWVEAMYAYALKYRDEAKQALERGEQVLKNAIAAEAAAEKTLADKKTTFETVAEAFYNAITQCDGAHMLLDALTSEETIGKLSEQKQAADEVLGAAMEDKAVKDAAWEQADADFKTASAEESQAKVVLQDTEERFTKALFTRDLARDAVTATAEELEVLRERYAPVLAAMIVRDSAAEEVRRTDLIMQDAKAVRDQAEAELALALHEKEVTADRLTRATGLSVEEALEKDIEDEEFVYLNEYIAVLRNMEANLAAAGDKLEAAETELAARKTDNENAQLAYAAAVVELAFAQEQAAKAEAEAESEVIDEGEAVDPEELPVYGETDDTEEAITPVETDGPADAEAPAEHCTEEVPATSGSETDSDAVLLAAASVNPAGAFVSRAEDSGHVFTIDPVATGDETETMALLAELLASAGLMAVVFKKRKEVRVKDRVNGDGSH